MLYVRKTDGEYWIATDANELHSTLLVVMSTSEDDSERWAQYVEVVLAINALVDKYGVRKYASVSYSANLLDISFHVRDGTPLPAVVTEAQQAIIDTLGFELREETDE